MSAPIERAAEIDAAVRGVPGVADLYFASPLPARVWRVAVSGAESYSSVAERDGVTEVAVSIGVAHGRADVVAGAVAERVRELLDDPAARVTVRVSRLV